jgi:hypothetical protein
MKRANEEPNKEKSGRKRVRFDPNTKDNDADQKPSAPKPRRPKREGDEFDILGRRIDQASSSNVISSEDANLDDRKHTLDSDEEDEKHQPKKLDINLVRLNTL